MSRVETRPVVLGIGQPMAGDDGVGIAVARALAASAGTGPGIDVRESTDATALLALLEEGRTVVVVDAVIGGGDAGPGVRPQDGAQDAKPGTILCLDSGALGEDGAPVVPVSSHGIGVAESLDLAATLLGEDVAQRVRIVGIVVARTERFETGLSPAVAAAVEPAAAIAGAIARSMKSLG